MTPSDLSATDLAIAAVLVLACAALSAALALQVHRQMLVAAARMVVQLMLVGLALRWLFAAGSPWWTALAVLAMLGAASREVGARSPRRLAGWWQAGLGAATVSAATLSVAAIAQTTALRPSPWYDARHAIPLVGIILGTVMNAGSLALNALYTSVVRERPAIEARLALGATRREAMGEVIRQAVMAGVIPALNQMAAAGIITMPGIMTGQVLAGMDPLAAARTQILLMFLLASGGFLGALLAVQGAARRLSDERHRLRLDRLVARR